MVYLLMPYKDKAKQNAYSLKRMKDARHAWIKTQGSSCANCNKSEPPFEVDHIDPATKVSHRIWSWSKERREIELAKCQLLCQACHQAKTARENSARSNGYVHGDSGYTRKKNPCRCTTCVEGHKQAKIDYRNRKRAAGLPYK